MQDGFLNKWRAKIPVGKQLINITGVCTVQLRDGLIYRNEVYFDTYALLKAIADWKTSEVLKPHTANSIDYEARKDIEP